MKPLPLLCLFGMLTIFRAEGQLQLRGHNTEPKDEFGIAVAISGDTMVVGARQEDGGGTGVNPPSDEGAENSGAAYVFVRVDGGWVQQAYLKASNTGSEDWFGRSVAIDGDTIVVGASGEDGSGLGADPPEDNNAQESGAAYVFVREDAVWRQQAYLKRAPGGPSIPVRAFGASAAISGATLIVGESSFSSYGGGVHLSKSGWGLESPGQPEFVSSGGHFFWLQCRNFRGVCRGGSGRRQIR